MGNAATVDTPELLGLLDAWLPARRWFYARSAPLEVVDRFALTDPQGEAEVVVLLLGPQGYPLVQVPLVLRSPGSRAGGLGTTSGLDVHDGASDPAYLRAWLAAAGVDPQRFAVGRARAITGEQSNSSVVLPGAADGGLGPTRRAAMLKVFRGIWPGSNPDVDVPMALAGWPHVPAPLATLEHTWVHDGVRVSGHLGVLTEFVPHAQDGFELACAMAARGESFAALAGELGAVIAQMHRRLARVLPVDSGASSGGEEVAGLLRERLRWAVEEVPELADWSGAVGQLADDVAGLDLPAPQRVHGDLHLGQVIRAEDAWYVLDFEGEPMVPLSERVRPDNALRDVAGVLRSLDYVIGRTEADRSWASEAGEAFLAEYRRTWAWAATGPAALVLRAFEVDKALYEVVYETQNRPHWVAIPWNALRRLVAKPTP